MQAGGREGVRGGRRARECAEDDCRRRMLVLECGRGTVGDVVCVAAVRR